MNKIVIIGNGFDLAHGLKTSYGDFIGNCFKDNPQFFNNGKSELFDRIEKINNSKNWVDIENLFFKLLLSYVDFSKPHQVNLQFIKSLNYDLELLRVALIDYLENEQSEKDIEPSGKYIELILKDFDNSIDDIILVNFNYIDTAERYLRIIKDRIGYSNRANIRCINIHGRINSSTEEPIFGIGDEYHSEYTKIKDLDDIDEILKFSKSFWYQKNNNYQELMNILDSYSSKKRGNLVFPQQFNVEIMGHSCGLSDRTLLKNIFDNKSIKSIILYHYPDKKGYTQKSYDIWRHFDNAHQFRMKLKPYNESDIMPQILKK